MVPESPSIAAIRSCRGDLAAIAATVWDDDAAAFAALSADAVYAVAELTLHQLAEAEGATIISLCSVFGGLPEHYMLLDEPCLGHDFNLWCLDSVRGPTHEDNDGGCNDDPK